MSEKISNICQLPEATQADPFIQVRWIFFQARIGSSEATIRAIDYACNKYINFIEATNAGYTSLEEDKRFLLCRYWEPDALIRFTQWILQEKVSSKTRYTIYKSVRKAMDVAYGLRLIDDVVYHAPMFKGVSETDNLAAYTVEAQQIINSAIARWIGLANNVIAGYEKTGKGVQYKGANLALQEAIISTSEPALKPPPASREARILEVAKHSSQREIILNGRSHSSIRAASIEYQLDYQKIQKRLKYGYTLEQAFELEPKYVHRNDERALLWRFENEFNCNAALMISEGRRRKNLFPFDEKLRRLFIRWGVWPYIDDRLIMPLAFALAMLTGLNVEAIKMLEVDAFQIAHPLTGRAAIRYNKPRSSSTYRPGERDLHLSLLDIEEVHLEDESARRVETLIGMVLSLTDKIRKDADQSIRQRLFIFEDVELSLSKNQKIVVPIDPRGKAGNWYQRFSRDEGLKQVLGQDFQFNLGRCRPTLITNMVLAGADILKIQAVAGHASIQTTAQYLDAQQLNPVFNKTVSSALEAITMRSTGVRMRSSGDSKEYNVDPKKGEHFSETLSGCGCSNPFSPSEAVRNATRHKDGAVCKYWNMCLFCDRSVITESSLPKLIAYRRRLDSALRTDAPSIRTRKSLYVDVIRIIDSVVESDEIFPQDIVDNARRIADDADDVLLDQLIYQGL